MSNFKIFSKQVADRLYGMSAIGKLFTVEVTGREVAAAYLAAFPPGTDPIFLKETTHNCSCCKHFIHQVGNVVSIEADGHVSTLWGNLIDLPEPYRTVAAALDALVKASPIKGLFVSDTPNLGSEHTTSLAAGQTIKWDHFHGKVHAHHVARGDAIGKQVGDYGTTYQVLQRGLIEIKRAAVREVLDLIESNSLYRGAEHLKAVRAFQTLQTQFSQHDCKDSFIWAHAANPHARFRNTVIGQLVVNISEGMPVDQAVGAFESMVAPANYKRPTALVTPAMVELASKKIEALGLEAAISRRLATLADVSVTDVQWVDGTVQTQLKGGLAGVLSNLATAPVKAGKVEDIGIEAFMLSVVPKALSMSLTLKASQQANFVALTAPVDPAAPLLFKWDNPFAWAYAGDVTDSIKERVKAAGGNVNALLRVSLSWHNFDDLDLFCDQPNGERIYFGNKSGILDVDMNAGFGQTREPVENLSWTHPADGVYRIGVDRFSRRESIDVGFELQVANDGVSTTYTFPRQPDRHQKCLELEVKAGKIVSLLSAGLTVGETYAAKPVMTPWGVQTATPLKVQTVLHSPNHWSGQAVGSKHYIFALEGCKTPEPVRGMYNEFLRSDLSEHSKVFEVLGSRTKCPQTDGDQLAGVGFTAARGDQVQIEVVTAERRQTFNVKF